MQRRVLVISQQPLVPKPWLGSQIRVARIAQALASRFETDLLWTTNEADVHSSAELAGELGLRAIHELIEPDSVELDLLWGNLSWGNVIGTFRGLIPRSVPLLISQRVPSAVVRWLGSRAGYYDLIWASRTWMAEAARAAGHSSIVVDVDDLESGMLSQQIEKLGRYKRRPLHRVVSADLRRYEISLSNRFSHVVVSNPDDLRRLGDASEGRVSVVQNGADIPSVEPVIEARAEPNILFIGALSYLPNVDAVLFFAEQVLPAIRAVVPGTRFCAAGRGGVSEALYDAAKRFDFTIVESPPTLSALYRNATCVVAPLISGQGTSLKSIEALANRKPLIATTHALRGFELLNDVHVLCADNAERFAEQCLRVLSEPSSFSEMASRGSEFVRQRYGWEHSGQQAVAAVDKVLSGKS